MHDISFWKALAEADYAVPDGEDIRTLTDELLGYLGSPDMTLRDDIAYTVMAHWAMRGTWSPDDFRHVLAYVTPLLKRGIGEAGNGVIERSFAALTLSLVAYGDWKHPFSAADEYAAMVAAACEYLVAESDLRGYVDSLGWLHATAHSADVLKFLARSRHATAEHLEAMLAAIADRLLTPTRHVFVHNEDERLSMAVLDIVKRDLLTPAQLDAFLMRLSAIVEREGSGDGFDPVIHGATMNVKLFLRALYFRLAFAGEQVPQAAALAPQVFEALKAF